MLEDLASTSTPNPQPPPRLVLGELLGRGAMTEVYRAYDGVLDRPVAVKVFHPCLHPAARLRFDAEAYALARLGHPGLVSIFDVGSLQDSPYLVLQLIDGDSLASRLLTGPLPESTSVGVGAVLADALAHAHVHGVVHRDVRPSNILLDRDDAPHLTDFGVALLTDRDRLSTDQASGASAYAAPEQHRGEDVGPAADVYALGLVLLACVTGAAECPDARRIPADLPCELADLLTAMTARDPSLRPSAARCARKLLALRTDEPRPGLTALPFRSAEVLPGWVDVDRPVTVTERKPAPVAISRPLAMVAVAAAVTAAATLVLANFTHPIDGRPSGAVAVSHSTTHNHSNTSIPAGVRVPQASTPRGTLLAAPVAGNQSIVDVHQLSGSIQAPLPVSSPAAPPTTTPTPTSEPGPTSTSTPAPTPAPTTEPSPSGAASGSPGTGNP
jgi:serine/threonine protein kinase